MLYVIRTKLQMIRFYFYFLSICFLIEEGAAGKETWIFAQATSLLISAKNI